MNIQVHSEVTYCGPADAYPELQPGDIGYILEDYKDGNFEVEFSNPDGSTRLLVVLPHKFLRPT